MNKFYRFVLLPLLVGLAVGVASAQNTTVSGTVTDSDGIAWANGTITFNLVGANNPVCSGTPMTPGQQTVRSNLDASGNISSAVCDNANITPQSSQWAVTVCSNTTAPCQNLGATTITGGSQNLTSFISTIITPIRIPVALGTRAYADVEIVNPPIGGVYYNLISNVNRTWNGNSWSSANTGSLGLLNASQLPHWTACSAKVKINAGSCRVLAIGDSTTMGAYSSPGNIGELFAGAYPAKLSQYLNSTLLPAQRDSFMGDGGNSNGTSVLFNDARIVSSGWTGASPSIGGQLFTATAAAALAFTPTGQVNQFTVWYVVNNPTTGVFSWTIDAGSPTNINETGATGLFSVVIPAGSVGAHTLHLNWVSGTVFFMGVEAVNTTVGSVNIINAGYSGSTAIQWNLTAPSWRPVPGVVTMAPDVVLLDLGINDWNTNTGESVASFTSNMQAMITAWKATCDIILITPAPSQLTFSGVPSLATQQQYVTAMYNLAFANNLQIIDNFNRWGSYELKNLNPFNFYGNGLHPSATGYSDFAQSIASQLLAITGH